MTQARVSFSPTRKVIKRFHTAKRFYHFNCYLTYLLINVKVEKKLPKNLLVSLIFITLSYVNIKQIDYEKVNSNLQTIN